MLLQDLNGNPSAAEAAVDVREDRLMSPSVKLATSCALLNEWCRRASGRS